MADLALKYGWFRLLLHAEGIARRPRNIRWHWQHIIRALQERRHRF